MNRTVLALLVTAMIAGGSALAQQTNPTVNDRRADQQQRVANGVQSGQLTAGEAKNLEGREAGLNREIRADRSADGGKLTSQERGQIHRQQNNLSKSIYADKHNAAQAHYGNGQVGQRRENQQDRIANGIRNGSMNAGEVARSENREQGINQEIRADRSANGKLTGQQQRQIHRQQNGASRQIDREKHNSVNAPK